MFDLLAVIPIAFSASLRWSGALWVSTPMSLLSASLATRIRFRTRKCSFSILKTQFGVWAKNVDGLANAYAPLAGILAGIECCHLCLIAFGHALGIGLVRGIGTCRNECDYYIHGVLVVDVLEILWLDASRHVVHEDIVVDIIGVTIKAVAATIAYDYVSYAIP